MPTYLTSSVQEVSWLYITIKTITTFTRVHLVYTEIYSEHRCILLNQKTN